MSDVVLIAAFAAFTYVLGIITGVYFQERESNREDR